VDFNLGIDPMPVLSSYLGLALAGAMFLSIGLLVSSLVRSLCGLLCGNLSGRQNNGHAIHMIATTITTAIGKRGSGHKSGGRNYQCGKHCSG